MIIHEIPYVVPVFGQSDSSGSPPYPMMSFVYYGTTLVQQSLQQEKI
ncbi:hypothetical protein LCGC14_1576540 [marine sediment metagenome]|uniref:Uncharacterized protein n=1 Tax=marine sediment metagenome TaxID=412755 RepID=A0A0F9KZ58_9ZZZZ